jgi:non-specific serine/threonine protein kinase
MEQQISRHASLLHLTETPLIGRDAECNAIERLLLIDRARLVSITGPGGVGKTRLALHLSAQLANRFRDGAISVFLVASSDHRLVPLAIARALDLKLSGEFPPEVELARALEHRELLLVIDTFEHLLPAARLFPRLLAACPELSILVTSRTTLNVPMETVVRLVPLVTPPRGQPGMAPAAARWYDAVALFEARAQAANSTFTLSDENAGAVAEICRRLDGLPLAIEIAAARTRALPPALMLRHLEERGELPGSGARDVHARHRTMRDAIAWSYDLLSPLDQQLFRALAVFRGSFTAKQAVDLTLRWSELHGEPALLRARIDLLARASLLVPLTANADEQSFVMLGVLREYGLDRLTEFGERQAVEFAHARWVAAEIDATSDLDYLPHHSDSTPRIEPLRDEIRAAIAWCIRASDRELAWLLLATIGPYWVERGNYQELRDWLEQALALWTAEPPPLGLLNVLAQIAARQGELSRSREYAETAYALAEEANNRSALGSAALSIANVEGRIGSVERSKSMAELALAIFRAIGDLRREAEASADLAHLAAIRGDLGSTQVAAEAALTYWQQAGEPARAIDMLDILSLVARYRGDSVRQSSLAHQTLQFAMQIDDPYQVASAFWTAAAIACERQRFPESARFYGAEEAIRLATGYGMDPGYLAEHEASVATARAALGARIFADEWEAGRLRSSREALAEATEFLGQIATQEREAYLAEKRELQSLGLSDRQQDVLRLIGQGRSDREIAEVLNISARTVSKHVEAILLRLDARTRSGAAAIAARLSAETATRIETERTVS